jgi:hypothetical protein
VGVARGVPGLFSFDNCSNIELFTSMESVYLSILIFKSSLDTGFALLNILANKNKTSLE